VRELHIFATSMGCLGSRRAGDGDLPNFGPFFTRRDVHFPKVSRFLAVKGR